jgi:hypothetical protein
MLKWGPFLVPLGPSEFDCVAGSRLMHIIAG